MSVYSTDRRGKTHERARTAVVAEPVAGQIQGSVLEEVEKKWMFSALRHRNFRLFCMGQILSLIGTWMQNTAQAWLVYQLTDSKMLLGVMAAIGSIPVLSLSFIGGSVADRNSKRSILMRTQFMSLVLSLVFFILVATHQIQVWQILVFAALGGVVAAFELPSRQSFIVELTSKHDLTNAISINSSIFNASRIIGPSLAGILMAKFGMGACFLINTLSFIPPIIVLSMLKLPEYPRPEKRVPIHHGAFEGLSYVARDPSLRLIFTRFTVVLMFGWFYVTLMPAFARDVIGTSEKGFGALLAANGIGALVGSMIVVIASQTVPLYRITRFGLWLLSIMIVCLSFADNFPRAMFCLIMIGMGNVMFISTSNSTVQLAVPDKMRGKVMGVWVTIMGGMMPLGGLLAGTLSHHMSVPRVLALGGIICVVVAGTTSFLKFFLKKKA